MYVGIKMGEGVLWRNREEREDFSLVRNDFRGMRGVHRPFIRARENSMGSMGQAPFSTI